MSEESKSQRSELRGVGISSGLGFAKARVIKDSNLQLPQHSVDDPEKEIERLRKAVKTVDADIAKMIRRASPKASKEVKAFLDLFRLLVNDETLFTEVSSLISQRSINAEWALSLHLEDVQKMFAGFSDSYLAERGDDIAHVVSRLQDALAGRSSRVQESFKDVKDEVILVTPELSLADVIWLTEFEGLGLAGIITEKGGPTSHTAVLAQTLFIPAVVGVSGAVSSIAEDDLVFIDSHTGEIVVNPQASEVEEIKAALKEEEKKYSERFKKGRRLARTKDGFKVSLKANVAMVSGLDEIVHLGAQGVGLFRSEYLFMGREELPTEEEQFESYRELADAMEGKPVTIRTIDVGGDKLLTPEARKRSRLSVAEKEENPALGLRAVRFALANPDLFLTQIRAILRAAKDANFRILIPLVSSLHEIQEARRYMELASMQLEAEGRSFNREVPLGIMIELPSTVVCADTFLEEADFASVGTNDLIQYTLGVDRGNPSVAPLYDELNPAVLRLIAHSVRTAAKFGKPVSICGEAGGRVELAPFFVGLGVEELSMAPMQIPLVKERICALERKSCARLAHRMLKAKDAAEARALLERFNAKNAA